MASLLTRIIIRVNI